MSSVQIFDKNYFSSLIRKLYQLFINKNCNFKDHTDEITILLNELIFCLHERKKEADPSAIDVQVSSYISLSLNYCISLET